MILRPDLYRRLCARAHRCGFGEVLVKDEGVEMSATVEHNALYNKPQLYVLNPGQYFAVNCPFCNDLRHRLWINHRWGYNDPRTKSRNFWLCHCYNEECLSTYQRQRALYDMVYDDDISNGRRLPPDPILKGTRPSRALCGVRPVAETVYPLSYLPSDHPANVYLLSRGYDPAQLSRRLRVGYCEVAYPEFPFASDPSLWGTLELVK